MNSRKAVNGVKKDIFNGNIKREFFSYMLISYAVETVVFCGIGALLILLSFANNVTNGAAIFLLMLGIASCVFGVWYIVVSLFVIRTYPKHKRLTRFFFNSDCYFVGSDSKEFWGHRWGRASFARFTRAAENNKGLEDIKYPKAYKIYGALTAVCCFLMLAFPITPWILLECVDMTPTYEAIVLAVCIGAAVLNAVLGFVFAFRVKRIRKQTIEAYRNEQRRKAQQERKK